MNQFIEQMMDFTGGLLYLRFLPILFYMIFCVLCILYLKKNKNANKKQRIIMISGFLFFFASVFCNLGIIFGEYQVIHSLQNGWVFTHPGTTRLFASAKYLVAYTGNGLYLTLGLMLCCIIGCVISFIVIRKNKNKLTVRAMQILFLILFIILCWETGRLLGNYSVMGRLLNGWTPN